MAPQHGAAGRNLLPYVASFVGRETELGEITTLLADDACRLLTLVGPGGIGKTRLAVEVASHLADYFADGVHFVPLQPLESAESIISTIAGVLNFQFYEGDPPRRQLHNYLSHRQLLLIMDNFEHLLAGADLIAEMVADAPECSILVTSREPLNLQAEWIWHVRGMAIPTDDMGENLDEYSAIRLFAERARQVQRDFTLADEQTCVVEICRLTEGNPLAIELAATWVKMLPCADIAAEIQRSQGFLADPRRDAPEHHRSMQAVFDWSWGLLSPEERAVFQRLSVFRGGFTLEAAEQVADATVNILARLVDQSLLRRLASARYDIHELLRQYAEAQLEAAREFEATQIAHSAYYAAFMCEHAIDIKGRRQREGLEEIEADLENLRTVWERAVSQRDYATLDQMMEGFYWFRNFRGLYQEVFQVAWDRMAPVDGEEPHRIAMKVFIRIAEYRHAMNADIEQALESARKHADEQEIAFCVVLLAWYLIDQGKQMTKGRHLAEERLADFRSVDDSSFVAEYLVAIGVAFLREGALDLAGDFLQQGYDFHIKAGNRMLGAWPLAYLNEMAHASGRYAEAENYCQQALSLWREAGGYPHGDSIFNSELSWLSIKQGKLDQATEFAQQALNIALNHNYIHKVGAALDKLQWVAFLEPNYEKAAQLHRQLLPILKLSPWPWLPPAYGDWLGSLIACGLQCFEDARELIQRALWYWTMESPEPHRMAQCLPVYAALLAHNGEHTRATELLALAFNHPTNADGWMATWPLLKQLHDHLSELLGEEAFEAAWKRGLKLELGGAVADLLDAPQVVHNTPQLRANRDLPEPLSPRELEVLQFLAARRTNQEIADELIIAVGTVKTHVYNICAKLAASNRFEVVSRATELGLL